MLHGANLFGFQIGNSSNTGTLQLRNFHSNANTENSFQVHGKLCDTESLFLFQSSTENISERSN